ncbi:MAG: MOSC N-terminal beta barrel domain-containing protein [Chitinophagaceae bacterium]
MMTVSELAIYPIKSLAGIQVQSALVTDRGFQHDRRWMLVDKDNQFLTQREYPAMALLNTGIVDEHLVITNQRGSMSSLKVPLQPDMTSSETGMVQIWSDRCRAISVSTLADEWFSDALSASCRLMYMPDETRRRVDGRYAHNQEITNFSDGYPFLVLGQASLDDLNSRLQVALPMNRFRPNIVFTGGIPYQEDTMRHFKIAGVDFFGVKLCARCLITTIDQQTGDKAKEPLKTLATYRKKNNNIYFGQNLLSKGEGMIRVGDELVAAIETFPNFTQQ